MIFCHTSRARVKNLILSKLSGPAFLGIFNKSESLANLPNDLMMPATMKHIKSHEQSPEDDMDEPKYVFLSAR